MKGSGISRAIEFRNLQIEDLTPPFADSGPVIGPGEWVSAEDRLQVRADLRYSGTDVVPAIVVCSQLVLMNQMKESEHESDPVIVTDLD